MGTNNINISIIIPLYNKEKSITKALTSIKNQTYKNYEVIVVNDGSTDSSVDVIKSFIDNNVFRLINKKNGGVSSARNLGIKEAKFDYLAFLDADDCWKDDFLESLVSLIRITKNAVLWGGRQEIITKKGKSIYSSLSILPNNFKGYINNYWKVAINGHLYHASSIIVNKNIIINECIKFNENLIKGEDLDFYFQIALKHDIAFTDKVISEYHLDTENRAMDKSTPFNKRLIGNLHNYEYDFSKNFNFRKFLSNYAVTCIGLLLSENEDEKCIKYLCKYIDFNLLTLERKIFYLLPNVIKKIIIYLK